MMKFFHYHSKKKMMIYCYFNVHMDVFEVSFEVPSMNKLNFAFEYFVMGIEQKRNYEVSTETPFFHSVKNRPVSHLEKYYKPTYLKMLDGVYKIILPILTIYSDFQFTKVHQNYNLY